MAQAVFDEHPLKQYLREAGEDLEIMPGSTAALALEIEPFPAAPLTEDDENPDNTDDPEWEWKPRLLIYLLHNIETIITAAQLTKPTNPLVERFKYKVISSSLLSPNLPTPHLYGQIYAQHHSIPGNLPHSRTPSDLSQAYNLPGTPGPCPSDSVAGEAQACKTRFGLLPCLVVIFAILLSAGLTRTAVLTLWTGLAGIYYLRVRSHATRLLDLTPCLETLDELILTNTNWETIVQEVITIVEKDEYTLSSSILPSYISPTSSSLRIALHSTLQSTQTQCDNVRHLLSALTSPSDLSQLSEMYAPPLQKKNFYFYDARASKSFSSSFPQERRSRPTSIPTTPSPSAVMTDFTDQKRKTWNGSHTNCPFSSPPMTPITRRRIRYQSDLSPLPKFSALESASFSVPATSTPSDPLTCVLEDKYDGLNPSFTDSSHDQSHGHSETEGKEHEMTSFGAAVLQLHRNRKANLMKNPPQPESISLISSSHRSRPNSANQSRKYSPSPRPSFISSPRYTAIHSPRQPLSSSTLRNELQAALGAKRYACAHLLALRFCEEDTNSVSTPTISSMIRCGSSLSSITSDTEDTYWDDVNSIMELLISALSAATSRLCAALREAEAIRLRDQTPTPRRSIDTGTSVIVGSEIRKLVLEKEATGKRKRPCDMVPPNSESTSSISFAPMPSQLSRFMEHIAAMKKGLEDAKEHLDECVAALYLAGPPVTRPSLSSEYEGEMETGDHHPVLLAYERSRRELGFALRECERGRNRLLDIVKLPQILDPEGEGSEGTPGLGHDSFSEESDKADNVISPSHSEDGIKDDVSVVDADEASKTDDATQELLLSAGIDDLPPAHINPEQVFEADTSVVSSTTICPRAKVNREARIKLVKARPESDLGLNKGLESSPAIHDTGDSEGGYAERWGPGGDVMQELKDVIRKVGERRRQVQSQEPALQYSQPFPSLRCLEENARTTSSLTHKPTSSDTLNSIPNLGLIAPSPNRTVSPPISPSRPRTSSRSSPDYDFSFMPRRTNLMDMESILASLQREVNEVVAGEQDAEEECILSSD